MRPFLVSAGAVATLWGGFLDGLADAAIPANEHEMGKALAAFVLLLLPVVVQWGFKRLLLWCRSRFGAPEVEALEVLRGLAQEEVAHALAGHVPPFQLIPNVQPPVPNLDAPDTASV
jgi:hypothetical protein